ncbi:hypothetical protein TRIUR3_26834 [Triticum urartu]|uniref:Uncharacterized protein n=1 Tax=Triticum urartu TaxID=4572 RepID=M7XDG0_TRIUA|nr:hypothetical protein TRIUR3_26834 [Triticum urartu]
MVHEGGADLSLSLMTFEMSDSHWYITDRKKNTDSSTSWYCESHSYLIILAVTETSPLRCRKDQWKETDGNSEGGSGRASDSLMPAISR